MNVKQYKALQAKQKREKEMAAIMPQYLAAYAKPGVLDEGSREWCLWKYGGYLAMDSPGAPALVMTLPGIGPSLNWFWSGVHWTTRKKIRDAWHTAVARWVNEYEPDMLLGTYHLAFIGEFAPGKNLYDASNLAATSKMMEDALVQNAVLPDDDASIIAPAAFYPLRGPRTYSTLALFER